jgi:molybdopterin-guanine dinucleotide biosynthesis protein A
MAFGWTDFMVRTPAFGLIAKNAKNFHEGREGWMNAEEKLCNTYKKYVSQLPKSKFLQRIEYMKHAGDLGRTPMGMGMKIFLFLLVAAESMGFSYLLGTWAASDGSANLYTQLMYGIVFVLASILAMVTHAAGTQFYRTSLIRSCYARYKEGGNTNFHSTRVISLSDHQFDDKNEPAETRCMNRIIDNPHDMGSYGWSWVAGVFVAAIFVLSGVMRFSHMEAEMTRESQAVEATKSNPFTASKMPSELVAPQQASDQKANAEARTNTAMEGGAAIIILGIIFVVTQIVGFGAGHKHCFAGKETYKTAAGSNSFWWWSDKDGAYADTWGYSTHDSYWDAMQPFKDIVNSRLKELQRLLKQNSPRNLNLTKTFDDYLALQARISEDSKTTHSEFGEAAAAAPVAAPVAPAIAVAPAPAPAAAAPDLSPVEQAKHDIAAITDKAEQQAYFGKLTPEVRDALKPWLKERKEKAAAVVSQAELDDLF